MFSLNILITIGLLALVVGCIVGALLNRTLFSQHKKNKSMEQRLQEAERQLTEYQQQVTDHFSETATLVNNLTRSYKDVHEHLVSNALQLANVDISRQLLTNIQDSDTASTDHLDQSIHFQPPKDWAPSECTLKEDYRLNDEDEKTDHHQHSHP